MGLTKRALWEKYGCHPMAEEDLHHSLSLGAQIV